MNILMISRATLFSSVGGDTIQIINTAKYLRNLDIAVDIKTTNDEIDYKLYDLIHFFNIIRPGDILPHIEKSNLPFVVSTIFVDYTEYEKNNRKGIPGFAFKFLSNDNIEYLKSIARHLKNGEKIRSKYYFINGYRKSVEHVAQKASFLLPNSDSEYKRFSYAYNTASKYKVVPNAVDTDLFDRNINENETYRNKVISVARIEGRKNQLNVIRAINDTSLSLVIIGNCSPNHIKYLELCRQEATDRVSFVAHLDQELLIPIYKAAKVHVLASWFETTGLSTMEAALLGCNIVITAKGDTREYFQDYAFYCDPGNTISIKSAIEKAYDAPYPEELRKLILENYTWEITAQKTFEAYKETLRGATILSIK